MSRADRRNTEACVSGTWVDVVVDVLSTKRKKSPPKIAHIDLGSSSTALSVQPLDGHEATRWLGFMKNSLVPGAFSGIDRMTYEANDAPGAGHCPLYGYA